MVTLNPDRYSTTGVSLRKTVIVVHDAESGDGAAIQLLAALQSPGDRLIEGSNPPRKYGSGYSAVTDGNGGYVEVADAHMGPFAAPPLNKTGWHVCMPGVAAQTRDQWLDDLSRNHIRGVARFIVDKSTGIDNLPMVRIDFHGLLAGDRGYCGHADVSQAWHQTDHTDPGPSFPWDVLADDIAALVHAAPAPPAPTPDPEDDMTMILYRDRRYNNVFRVGDSAITIGEKVLLHDRPQTGEKLDFIEDVHDQSLIAYMRSSHLTMAQMVPSNETAPDGAQYPAFPVPADLA